MDENELASMELSYQIQVYLNRTNKTIAQLAVECGIEKCTVEDAFNQKQIAVSLMSKICDVLKISLDDLRRPAITPSLMFMLEQVLLLNKYRHSLLKKHHAIKIEKKIRDMIPSYERSRNAMWLMHSSFIKDSENLYTEANGLRDSENILGEFPKLHPALGFSKKSNPKDIERGNAIIAELKKKK